MSDDKPQSDEDAEAEQALNYTLELGQIYDAERARVEELQASHEVLRQRSEHRTTFTRLLAQELHTPAASIDGYLSLAATQPQHLSLPQQKELLGLVTRRVAEISQLVQELADFAELSAQGGLTATARRSNTPRTVGQIVKAAARSLKDLAAQRGLKLKQAVGPATLRFRDNARLEIIIQQLWSSALESGSPGGTARLTVTEEDGNLILQVAVDGAGIAPQQRAAIVAAFQQPEPSAHWKRSDLSLDLAIVRLAVRNLGGSLTLESGLGHGSTFKLLLPITTAGTVPSAEIPEFERQTRLLVNQGVVAPGIEKQNEDEYQVAITRRDEQLLRYAQDFKTAYAQERAARQALKRAYLQTVRAFSLAVEARDYVTGDHIGRVSTSAVAIGRELGMAADDLERIEIAGMLHDVGKLRVPDAVLLKPGPLNDEEWVVMRAHTDLGSEITGEVELLEQVSRIVRAHHERLDGRGYPDGLIGEAIPIEARIIAVADVFDAITSERPYHKAAPASEAIEHLQAESGSHFDPDVVRAFESAWKRGAIGRFSGA